MGMYFVLTHSGALMDGTSFHTGTAKFTIIDKQIPLSGPNSIIGRAVVVHGDQDDLGKAIHDMQQFQKIMVHSHLATLLYPHPLCSLGLPAEIFPMQKQIFHKLVQRHVVPYCPEDVCNLQHILHSLLGRLLIALD
ncbi:hypothetical protein F2P56_019403 [Juglans regia]|uniref:Superoxide dismutase copper/zinc binding domain-containing protein n=1 Tax=Juglans regia TaxID=51240 RepID=A0A833XBN4_JUGRE|nr:hypothetical protein F2P56_019403 [Juglans regia]